MSQSRRPKTCLVLFRVSTFQRLSVFPVSLLLSVTRCSHCCCLLIYIDCIRIRCIEIHSGFSHLLDRMESYEWNEYYTQTTQDSPSPPQVRQPQITPRFTAIQSAASPHRNDAFDQSDQRSQKLGTHCFPLTLHLLLVSSASPSVPPDCLLFLPASIIICRWYFEARATLERIRPGFA